MTQDDFSEEEKDNRDTIGTAVDKKMKKVIKAALVFDEAEEWRPVSLESAV